MSTLTSWRCVFADKGPARVFLLLLPALMLAVPLSSFDLPEKNPVVFLFLLSVLSCLPFIDSPEYLLDSARYFLQAKYLKVYGISVFFREWGGEITAWTDLPLVPLVYGILFKLFGETKLVITFLNVLLFGFTNTHLFNRPAPVGPDNRLSCRCTYCGKSVSPYPGTPHAG